MGLRAWLAATRRSASGAVPASGRIHLACVLVVPVLALVLSASSVAAQRAVTARAVVHVPTVSQLDVAPVSALPASSSTGRAGLLRVRVRANHSWKVLVAVPAGLTGSVQVRLVGDGSAGSYRRLEPGAEAVIAAGEGGEAEMRVEYRWEGDPPPDGLPIRTTLSAARL